MEIGPEFCFWSDSSTELNKAPLLTLSQPVDHVNGPRPYSNGGLPGVVLELESDSELDEYSSRRWDEEVIKLTPADLEDSEPSSPVSDNPQDLNIPEFVDLTNNSSVRSCNPTAIDNPQKSPLQLLEPPTLTPNSESQDAIQTTANAIEPACDNAMPQVDSSENQSVDVAQPSEPHNPMVFPNQNSVKCARCERTFRDNRSCNIHMNKTHLVKTTPHPRSSSVRKIVPAPMIVKGPDHSAEINASSEPNTMLSPVEQNRSTQSLPTPQAESICSVETAPDDEPRESHTDALILSAPKDQPAESNPTAQKTRPVYTVSSPPPGSPGFEGALKIRLISVKNRRRNKHHTKLVRSSSNSADSIGTTEPVLELNCEQSQLNTTPTTETQRTMTESEPEESVQLPSIADPSPYSENQPAVNTQPELPHSSPSGIRSESISGDPALCNQLGVVSPCVPPITSETVLPQPLSPALYPTSQKTLAPGTLELPSSSSGASLSPTSLPPSSSLTSSSIAELNGKPAIVSNRSDQGIKTPTHVPVLDTTLRTRDGMYECRVCQRHFRNRFSLTGHYKSHYSATQKPYKCDDCGQRFTSTSNLHYHRFRSCPVLRLKASESVQLLPSESGCEVPSRPDAEKPRTRRATASASGARSLKRSDPFPSSKPSDLLTTSEPRSTASKVTRLSDTGSTIAGARPKSKSTRRMNPPAVEKPLSTVSFYSTVLDQPVATGPKAISNHVLDKTRSIELSSFIQTHLKEVIEQAYQSDKMRQELLALTSAAIVSVLSSSASDRTHQVQAFINQLIRVTSPSNADSPRLTDSTGAFHPISSSELDKPPMSASSNSDGPRKLTATRTEEVQTSSDTSSPSRPKPPMNVDCAATKKATAALLHTNRADPVNSWMSCVVNELPSAQATLNQHLNTLLSGSMCRANQSEPSVITTAKPTIPTRVNNNASVAVQSSKIQCAECSRSYSSRSAYRLHFRRTHQNAPTGSGARGKSQRTAVDVASNTLFQTDWRELCPR